MSFINTPGTNDLWIADPDAAQDILKRLKDFIPLPSTEAIAGSFGLTLLTAHGEQWQKQRRLIAPNFNEGISALRWLDSRGEVITPAKGTFLPWSSGPRACPGIKMAQAEFVAVLTTLLSCSKVGIVTRAGENSNAAQKKLWELMQDSQTKTTLQMNRPKGVRLRFVRT